MIEKCFDKEIYTEGNLLAGIAAYQGLATIGLNEDEHKWILRFSACKYDEKLTAKEFENYIIGLENIHANS